MSVKLVISKDDPKPIKSKFSLYGFESSSLLNISKILSKGKKSKWEIVNP